MQSRISVVALCAAISTLSCSPQSSDSTETSGGRAPVASGGKPSVGSGGSASTSGGQGPIAAGGSSGGAAAGAANGGESSCAYQCVSDCSAAKGTPKSGACSSGQTCCALAASGGSGGATTSSGGGGSGGSVGGNGASGGSNSVAGAAAGGAAGAGSGAVYDYAAKVENTGADCPVSALAEPTALPTIKKLPDPFKKIDGTAITKKSDWRCRRQEIRKQAERYIYGDKPTPDKVSGTVTNTKISVHVEAMSKSIDFSADVVLPSKGQAPFPAIINVGTKGGFGGISLGESRILDQGVAVIYYDHYALGKEGTAEQSRGKPNPGKFYDIYGGDYSAGLLMAWAWGASRLIDVIQQSGSAVIDVGKLGVTGCSRNGKGAFAVGVFDERIALTIPQETSTAGVPVYRMVDILNTERTDHNYFGLNWLSNNFEPFVYKNGTSNAVKLPIDTHELVAMIAPRGLLVLDNPHQTQMSAPAGHLGTAAGAEVYKALGVGANVSYHSSVSDTAHCSYKTEYTDLLVKTIGKFLKHDNEEPGKFIVGQGGDGKLADWKEWTTPTLAD